MAIPVYVGHRIHGDKLRPAVRVGDLVLRDELYERHSGLRRYFWLLTYGVQLVYEPFGWRDEWYVDVVDFAHGREDGLEAIRVADLTLDLVVEGMGPTYRILDLDELARELDRDAPARTVEALRRAQVFLDAFRHRGAPFPPPAVAPWFSPDHAYPPLPEAPAMRTREAAALRA
jgi:hypothetical protein